MKTQRSFFFALLLLGNLFTSLTAKGQDYCSVLGAFLSPSYPQSIDTFTVHVDTATTYYGQPFYVKLKFARPMNDILPFAKRPLMIGIHGGGFVSDSLGMAATNAYLTMYGSMYNVSQFGYVTASLDYRTGFGVANENNFSYALAAPGLPACNVITPALMDEVDNATYRATYDCLKAVDFICKNSAQFPYVDTSQIYLYGGSAGAITALHAVLSEANEFGTLPVAEQLPFPQRHKIAGVLSMAGAVHKATIDTLLQHPTTDKMTPLFLAHGNIDGLVLHNTGPLASCINLPASYDWYGSSSLADIACDLGIPHQLFLIDSAGHDLGGANPIVNTLLSVMFTYIVNVGICPVDPQDMHKMYDLQGNLLSGAPCAGTGLEETGSTDLRAFPNPVSSSVTLEFDAAVSEFEVDVTDLLGQKLLSISNSRQVDLSSCSPGMYMIRVSSGQKNWRRLVVKG